MGLTEPPTSNIWRRKLIQLADAAYRDMHGISANEVEPDGRHEAIVDGPAGCWRYALIQRPGDGPTEGVGVLLPE